MDWVHPLIGLDLTGLDQYLHDWVGLTVMYRIMTAHVFSVKQTETILCNNQRLITYVILTIYTALASLTT